MDGCELTKCPPAQRHKKLLCAFLKKREELKLDRLKFSRELVGDEIQQVVEDGVRSERLGFDYVWVPDHLVDIRPLMAIFDAWTTLAYIGARTNSIKLGSGVTD